MPNAHLNDVLIYLTYESALFMHFFVDIKQNKLGIKQYFTILCDVCQH
jgi:hypothetical protein